jgi:hypothetical protein
MSYVSCMQINVMIESSYCFQKCNRHSGHRCVYMVRPKFWVDYYIPVYSHCWSSWSQWGVRAPCYAIHDESDGLKLCEWYSLGYDPLILFAFFFILLDLTAWLPPKFCGVFCPVSATPEVALSLKQDIWLCIWAGTLFLQVGSGFYFGCSFQVQVKGWKRCREYCGSCYTPPPACQLCRCSICSEGSKTILFNT